MTEQDIAIAHWAGHFNGGGERVAWDLQRTFDAPLYVGYRDESIEPEDVDAIGMFNDGWFGRMINHGGKLGRLIAYKFAWEIAEDLREYDTIVTSGIEPLYYVRPPEQTWVAYTHHTHRQSTDRLVDQINGGLIDRIKQVLYWIMRVGVRNEVSKPDHFVANSEFTKRRMKQYWGLAEGDITVVYPGISVGKYGSAIAETQDYYVTLSRLDWHKRIGEIIKAFNETDKTLIVAGDGSERDKLENMAGENIIFEGYVSEHRKRVLLSSAKAFIFNSVAEDFGLVDVEAYASGTPVLAVEEGMPKEKVANGKNGYTYARGELLNVIDCFETDGVEWSDAEIEAFADQFSTERFSREMHNVVIDTQNHAGIGETKVQF